MIRCGIYNYIGGNAKEKQGRRNVDVQFLEGGFIE